MGRHSILLALPLAFRPQCTRIGGTELHGLRTREMVLRNLRDTLGALDHIGRPQLSCSTSAAFRRPGGFSTPTHSSTCLRVPRQYHHRCSLPSLAKPCPRNSMDKPQRWHFALRAFLRTDICCKCNFATSHFSVIACRSRTSISSFSNSMNVMIIIIDF